MIFLPRNLVFLLKKFGATQAQLAIYTGVSQNSISNWVNDVSSPNVAALVKLYQFFGISLDALVLTDLENSDIDFTEHIEAFKESGNAGGKATGKTMPVAKAYLTADTGSSIVSEPDPVANWAIMGQFKEVHRKLDVLIDHQENNSEKRRAGK
ncbi:MAG: helix-turn-helix transcriptional regulator [Chitinophagaceae bacterium]|nr:helix-turn-helix transcriptional regulator [Chitinophagaceae bacterium]